MRAGGQGRSSWGEDLSTVPLFEKDVTFSVLCCHFRLPLVLLSPAPNQYSTQEKKAIPNLIPIESSRDGGRRVDQATSGYNKPIVCCDTGKPSKHAQKVGGWTSRPGGEEVVDVVLVVMKK